MNCGIAKEQGEKMLAILIKVLANQIDPDAVMKKLDEILHAVNPNAPKVTYTFDGSKREISPGRSSLTAGVAFGEFQQMISLQNSGDWADLLRFASRDDRPSRMAHATHFRR
jgi:hypothetical protein